MLVVTNFKQLPARSYAPGMFERDVRLVPVSALYPSFESEKDKLSFLYHYLPDSSRKKLQEDLLGLHPKARLVPLVSLASFKSSRYVKRSAEKLAREHSLVDILDPHFVIYLEKDFNLRAYMNILDTLYDIPVGSIEYSFTEDTLKVFKEKNVPIYLY